MYIHIRIYIYIYFSLSLSLYIYIYMFIVIFLYLLNIACFYYLYYAYFKHVARLALTWEGAWRPVGGREEVPVVRGHRRLLEEVPNYSIA